MMERNQEIGSSPVYRVDKFSVPPAGYEEFLGRVSAAHEMLRQQAGFVRDLVLEQQSGPGDFNIVTLVEWESEAAMAKVIEVIDRKYRESGFDRQATLTRLGIRADIGNYAATRI